MVARGRQFGGEDDWSAPSSPGPVAPRQKAVRKSAKRTLNTFNVPTHDPDTGKKHTKKKVADLQRGALVRHEAAQTGANVGRRKKWEASPEGRERTKEAPQLVADMHWAESARQRSLGQHHKADHLEAVAEYTEKLSPAQVHQHILGTRLEGHGYGDQQLVAADHPHEGPGLGQASVVRTAKGAVKRNRQGGATPAAYTGPAQGPSEPKKAMEGIANPHEVGTPRRWEELAPHEQEHAHRELKRRTGATMDSLIHHYGAQLDQSSVRALGAGHVRASTGEPVPFTKHFYDKHPDDAPSPLDRPKEMLKAAAANPHGVANPDPAHAVDFGTMVGATALTSPNTKFTAGPRGERVSPNINAAREAIIQHHQGISAQNMGHIKDPQDPRGLTMSQARPANIQRAGRMLEHTAAGGKMVEARNAPSESHPEGSTMWSAPKVGPFTNSFHGDIPDFFVSDVHSGGGGGLPHLGTSKPFLHDAQGEKIRTKDFHGDPRSEAELKAAGHGPHKIYEKEKSERELGIESPHFHSMMDYAARQAHQQRGLGSTVRQGQAMQWGEEQIQRKIKSPKLDVPSHESAYPHPSMVGKQFSPPTQPDAGSHQLDLF